MKRVSSSVTRSECHWPIFLRFEKGMSSNYEDGYIIDESEITSVAEPSLAEVLVHQKP